MKNKKKEFSVKARMQKYCSKSLASSSWTSNISLFFLSLECFITPISSRKTAFFSNIFIIRTIVKMPARDQTLLVLDSEIDHKQLKAYCVLRSSPDPILIHYWLKRKYSQLAGSSFQRVGKKHTTITTFRATFSHIFPVLAKRDVKILKLCGPYQT